MSMSAATESGNLHKSAVLGEGFSLVESLAAPIGFRGGDTNLSRYVGNAPTMYTDPSGLSKKGGAQQSPNICSIAPSLTPGYWLVIGMHETVPFGGGSGHSWVGLIDATGKDPKIKSGGYYPESPPSPSYKTVPGMIKDDSKTEGEYFYVLPITKAEYDELNAKLEDRKKNPGNYQLRNRNCTTFAVDMLREVHPIKVNTDSRAIGVDPNVPIKDFYSPPKLHESLERDRERNHRKFKQVK